MKRQKYVQQREIKIEKLQNKEETFFHNGLIKVPDICFNSYNSWRIAYCFVLIFQFLFSWFIFFCFVFSSVIFSYLIFYCILFSNKIIFSRLIFSWNYTITVSCILRILFIYTTHGAHTHNIFHVCDTRSKKSMTAIVRGFSCF